MDKLQSDFIQTWKQLGKSAYLALLDQSDCVSQPMTAKLDELHQSRRELRRNHPRT